MSDESTSSRTITRRRLLTRGAGLLGAAALVPASCAGGEPAPDGLTAESLPSSDLAPGTNGVAPNGSVDPRLPALPRDMIHRPILGTDETVPVIGLGTWQTFDVGSSERARAPLREVLRAFHELGGTVVDSSPMYGQSEEVLGDLSTELGIADELFFATKVWTRGNAAGRRQMERSMAEMKRPVVDLIKVHNLVDVQTHLDTLAEWKAEGRIRYMGISHYHAGAYADVERLLDDPRLDFLQINYSLAEREAERRVLPKARERGVSVVINRPFAGGALFRRVQGRELPAWAAEIDCTAWSQFFLKFIVSHPAVTCAIPATSRLEHLRDNMGGGGGRLPDEDMRRRMAAALET